MKCSTMSALAAVSFVSSCALAYERETHEVLSEAALNASALATDELQLKRLRLQRGVRDPQQRSPDSNSEPLTVLGLVRQGARYEDESLTLPSRPLNHFFDPSTGNGLYIDAWAFVGVLPKEVIALIVAVNLTSQASPDWALDSGTTAEYGDSI